MKRPRLIILIFSLVFEPALAQVDASSGGLQKFIEDSKFAAVHEHQKKSTEKFISFAKKEISTLTVESAPAVEEAQNLIKSLNENLSSMKSHRQSLKEFSSQMASLYATSQFHERVKQNLGSLCCRLQNNSQRPNSLQPSQNRPLTNLPEKKDFPRHGRGRKHKRRMGTQSPQSP